MARESSAPGWRHLQPAQPSLAVASRPQRVQKHQRSPPPSKARPGLDAGQGSGSGGCRRLPVLQLPANEGASSSVRPVGAGCAGRWRPCRGESFAVALGAKSSNVSFV